ncbi:MAG: DUF3696 domain-containing protein [Cyclobacteriaceae bacterium]|nr:DUF3696 domain-containing protein [Cyclobacteriaceae bacterium]
MAVHSNYEIRWKNFKGFKDTGWIEIKPITILLGSNNSGKTSLIAPLLLMNQTISSKDTTTPLIVKGDVYDGGTIEELSHEYDLKNDIFFGFKYHIHKSNKSLKKIGTYPPGAFEVEFSVRNDGDQFIKKETIYDMYFREFFCLKKEEGSAYQLTSSDFKKINAHEKETIGKSKPLNFLFSPNSVISAFRKELKKDENSIENFSSNFSKLLQAISYNYSMVSKLIGGLSYIGPIRENPHRHYEIGNESYKTVGHKGENTANLLKKNIGKIQNDLDFWVKKFGFGDKILFKHLSSTIYSILFTEINSNSQTNIANVGFGASQILPLIVQALVSPKESLTIAEQPEIHLNPKLQCVLADLFAFMVKRDQRIIVETHSEHLLLRLRLLIANKTLKSKDVAIYFIEKEKGNSVIKRLNIEEDGHISNNEWPKDFFEDSLRESLALATAQIKRKSKSKN